MKCVLWNIGSLHTPRIQCSLEGFSMFSSRWIDALHCILPFEISNFSEVTVLLPRFASDRKIWSVAVVCFPLYLILSSDYLTTDLQRKDCMASREILFWHKTYDFFPMEILQHRIFLCSTNKKISMFKIFIWCQQKQELWRKIYFAGEQKKVEMRWGLLTLTTDSRLF